jgi:cullin 1
VEIRDDFQRFLDYDKHEDLHRIALLLGRIPEGLIPLHMQFQKHVQRSGQQTVSKLVMESGGNPATLEPRVYVDMLFGVVSKHQDMVQRTFKSGWGFAAALEGACRDFVNQNAATGTSLSKSAELMANRADELLHKSNMLSGEGEVEGALSRLVCKAGEVVAKVCH